MSRRNRRQLSRFAVLLLLAWICLQGCGQDAHASTRRDHVRDRASSLTRSVAAAGRHWKTAVPSCLRVRFVDLPGDEAGYARPPCDVDLDRVEWHYSLYETRCAVVIHEIGHLLGHRHEEGGIMDPGPAMYRAAYSPECDPPARAHRARKRRRRHHRRRRRHGAGMIVRRVD